MDEELELGTRLLCYLIASFTSSGCTVNSKYKSLKHLKVLYPRMNLEPTYRKCIQIYSISYKGKVFPAASGHEESFREKFSVCLNKSCP